MLPESENRYQLFPFSDYAISWQFYFYYIFWKLFVVLIVWQLWEREIEFRQIYFVFLMIWCFKFVEYFFTYNEDWFVLYWD